MYLHVSEGQVRLSGRKLPFLRVQELTDGFTWYYVICFQRAERAAGSPVGLNTCSWQMDSHAELGIRSTAHESPDKPVSMH